MFGPVINDPAKFDAGGKGKTFEMYRRTYADLDGDGLPEMIVEGSDRNGGTFYGSVYTADGDKPVLVKGDIITEGDLGDGHKGTLVKSGSDKGFYLVWTDGKSGINQVEKYTVVKDGDSFRLEKESAGQYNSDKGEKAPEDLGEAFQWQ